MGVTFQDFMAQPYAKLRPEGPLEYCPDCGGKLLYNGQVLVCIACPFEQPKPDSVKRLPAARSTPETGNRETS
jgi:hypothetical protein